MQFGDIRERKYSYANKNNNKLRDNFELKNDIEKYSDVSNLNDTTSLMIQNVIYGYLEYEDVEIVAILIESRIPLRLTLKVHIYLYQS